MKKRAGGLMLAAARLDAAPLALTAEEADLSAGAIATFEAVLGGRDALVDALCVADGSPEVDKITSLLLDARYDGWSLRRVCATAGLTVADFFAAYKKAALVRAHLQLVPVITQKLVGVVDDLLTRAQPHYLPCGVCQGSGTVTPAPTRTQPTPSAQTCESCQGQGRVLHLPDLDRQKLALEVAEVIKPRAGFTFNQATVVAASGGAAPGALEQLQQAVSAVLYAPGARTPVVDGQVLADAAPPETPEATRS